MFILLVIKVRGTALKKTIVEIHMAIKIHGGKRNNQSHFSSLKIYIILHILYILYYYIIILYILYILNLYFFAFD